MTDNKLLDVEIITPQKVIHKGKAISVSVPGSKSPFQILYNHAPIVSALDMGIIKLIDEQNNPVIFASNSGFIEVRKNYISILVEAADNAASLEANLIDEQMKNAESDLESASKDEAEKYMHIIASCKNKLNAIDRL